MLVGFEPTLALLRDYRICSIIGHPGSHKTSLSFRIAYEMYRHKMIDRIFSNVPSVWTEDLAKLELADPSNVRACVILDEGGQFIESRHEAKPYMAFLRKMDCYLLLPSFYPPTLKLRTLQMEVDRKYTRVGLPLLRYQVRLESVATRATLHFYWWRPSEVYGLYDTVAAPVDADEVGVYLTQLKDRLVQQTTGKSYSQSKSAGYATSLMPLSEEVQLDEQVSALEDAAEQFGVKVAALEHLQQGQKKRGIRRLLFGR